MAGMDRPVTRALLWIGITVVVVNGFFLVTYYGPGRDGPMFAEPPGAFPIILVPILGFLGSLFGLWRMWVAMRGPR
jgi:hypothetical protein